jgi:hypothetical protein
MDHAHVLLLSWAYFCSTVVSLYFLWQKRAGRPRKVRWTFIVLIPLFGPIFFAGFFTPPPEDFYTYGGGMKMSAILLWFARIALTLGVAACGVGPLVVVSYLIDDPGDGLGPLGVFLGVVFPSMLLGALISFPSGCIVLVARLRARNRGFTTLVLAAYTALCGLVALGFLLHVGTR